MSSADHAIKALVVFMRVLQGVAVALAVLLLTGVIIGNMSVFALVAIAAFDAVLLLGVIVAELVVIQPLKDRADPNA